MTLTLTSYVISTSPKISVVPEFLSEMECQHLISISESEGFQVSLVGRGQYSNDSEDKSEGFQNVLSQNRTSSSVVLQPSQGTVVAEIEARLAGLVDLPVEQLESLVVVKYESGQFFRPHHDGVFRSYTVFIYLNDLPPDGGGETRFPEIGLRIKPSRGTAVVWKNSTKSGENGELVQDDRLVHEGLPTVSCVKYGVNCFFNYNQMR
jgi:prolyl 4-hydroxylase